MGNWHKFTAYNSQAQYGYGTEKEAEKYADFLNRNREINVYGFAVVNEAEQLANLESDDAGFNLNDCLAAIRDVE